MKLNTIQHPKLFRLKRRLSLQTWGAVGILESLWHLTATHAKDGAIGRAFTDEDIANAIGWEGCPEQLIGALVSSGWLDACAVNRLVVHDWNDHCPDFVRGNLGRLKADFAVPTKMEPLPTPVPYTSTLQVYDTPVGNTSTVHQSPTPRPKPKPIQTKPISPLTPQGGEVVTKQSFDPKAIELPAVLATKEFLVTWQSWCDYRSEARKKLKHRSAKAQLAELADWGHDAAIQSIYQSIRNGWTGLFLPKGHALAASKPPPPAPRPWSEVFAEQEQAQGRLIDLEVRHG